MALVALKTSTGEGMKKIVWAIVLLALLWAVLWIWQQPSSQSQRMDMWPSIAVENIHKIIIQKKGAQDIVLQLQQKQWRLADNDLAEQDAVLRLLDDLTAMQVIRVVTRKHEYDDELGMLARAVIVQCLDAQGVVLLDVTVGKQGSDLLSTYVRRAGDYAVVAVNRSLVWQVKRSKRAWKVANKKQ